MKKTALVVLLATPACCCTSHSGTAIERDGNCHGRHSRNGTWIQQECTGRCTVRTLRRNPWISAFL